MRVNDATVLCPVTEKPPHVNAQIRDERDDRGGGPFLGPRTGLRGQCDRRCENRDEEEDEDDALREGATRHKGPFGGCSWAVRRWATRAPL